MSQADLRAGDTVLRLDNITKRFGALIANSGVSLDLKRGEVVALLGENGAGKTTLMNILFGHYHADEGRVEVFGQTLPPGNPRAALAAGVGEPPSAPAAGSALAGVLRGSGAGRVQAGPRSGAGRPTGGGSRRLATATGEDQEQLWGATQWARRDRRRAGGAGGPLDGATGRRAGTESAHAACV